MPGPSSAGKPWEGMDWRDEGTPEWRDSLSDEQFDAWRTWRHDSQAESGEDWRLEQTPDEPIRWDEDAAPSEPLADPRPEPQPRAEAPEPEPEPALPAEPPDPTGKPWDGMDPLGEFSNDFRLSLSDAEADEFAEWRDWHEQKAEQEENERFDREQREREEQVKEDIRREQETGEIDAYRLAHGAPAPPSATVGFVDLQGNPLDAVVKDQPLFIQVTIPLKDGEARPDSVDVTVSGQRRSFIDRDYQATDDVTLVWIGNTVGDPIYRSSQVTIENGGEGAEDLGVPGYEFNVGGMGGFSVDDGDYVTVQHGSTTAGAQVFSSVTKLEIALTLTAISAFHQSYINVVINLNNLEKDALAQPDSPERTEVLKDLEYTRAQAIQVINLANKAIAYMNTDTLDHQKLAILRMYGSWMGLFVEPVENEDGTTKRQFGPVYVPTPSDEVDHIHFTSKGAKEEVRRILWSGLTQATIGGYRLFAQATMVAQIMTMFGTNEMGRKATTMERWMAFADLVSQAALMGAMMKWNYGNIVGRTGPRVTRTATVKNPDVAKTSPAGTPVAPEAAGMLRHASRDAQLTMRKHDAVAQVRFTNVDALGPRAMGWKPKPMDLKSKTIKPVDREIGAPEAAHDGAVGLFEPKLPQRGNRTDAQWKAIQARYNERLGEWDGAIGAYQRKLVEQGKYTHRDGMMCDTDGTPITGDYDLFEISYRDGTPVPANVYDQIVTELKAAPGFQAAHGAHMRWNPRADDPGYHIDFSADLEASLQGLAKWQADRAIFRDIQGRHQPGGEGLITFAPNQPPVITYAGEAVGPKFADISTSPIAAGSAADGTVLIRPTLFVATTDQLLAGRYPTGDEWNWTQQTDWPTWLEHWHQQADDLNDLGAFQSTNSDLAAWPVATPAQPANSDVPAVVDSGTNWRPIAVGGIVIGGLLLLAGGGFLFFGSQNQPPPVAVVSPTPLVAPPASQSRPTASQAQPTVTARATVPARATVTAPPITPGSSLLAALGPLINESLDSLVAAPDQWVENTNYLLDADGDLYLPNDGSPATAIQPWVDLTGAFGIVSSITPGQAVGLSSHPCGGPFTTSGGFTMNTACNQSAPLAAGDYLMLVTTWAEALPDPFPQTAQCVFSVQSDVDNDRTTGFSSPLPFNYLTGADVYYENLFFWGQDGTFQNYVLATDHSRPPRTDTGEIHGNRATNARVVWGSAVGSPSVRSAQTFLIPTDEMGDNATVGGFCATDRAAMGPATLAVDAVGEPVDQEESLASLTLTDLFFPPRE